MSIKKLITIEPVKYKVDKKGNKIPVYRSGIKDTNKYAKRGPGEQRDLDNLNNRSYKK
jgi:hypothetical protein